MTDNTRIWIIEEGFSPHTPSRGLHPGMEVVREESDQVTQATSPSEKTTI